MEVTHEGEGGMTGTGAVSHRVGDGGGRWSGHSRISVGGGREAGRRQGGGRGSNLCIPPAACHEASVLGKGHGHHKFRVAGEGVHSAPRVAAPDLDGHVGASAREDREKWMEDHRPHRPLHGESEEFEGYHVAGGGGRLGAASRGEARAANVMQEFQAGMVSGEESLGLGAGCRVPRAEGRGLRAEGRGMRDEG